MLCKWPFCYVDIGTNMLRSPILKINISLAFVGVYVNVGPLPKRWDALKSELHSQIVKKKEISAQSFSNIIFIS